jgi:predicted permease
MESFLTVLSNSLPIFVTVLLTLFLKARGILTEETRRGIGPIIFKFMIPFFVFNVLYNQVFTKDDISLILILIGFTIVAGTLYGLYLRSKPWAVNVKSALLITFFAFSVGSFAYPFVQLNFAPEVFGKIVILDMALFVLLMIIGPIVGTVSSVKAKSNFFGIVKGIFSDTIFLTLLLALTVNILNINIPAPIVNTADFISRGFIFIVLVYVGLSLRMPDKTRIRQVLQIFLFRHLVIIGFLFYIINMTSLETISKQALFLVLFTPFSAFGMNYTQKYDVDGETIAQLSISSTVFYIFFYPLVVTLALSF